MRHHLVVLRVSRASPPTDIDPSGKVPLLATVTWPQSRPPSSGPTITSHLARTQRRSGAGSQPSPPGAPTHVLWVPRPAAPRPGRFQLGRAPKRRSSFSRRPEAGPRCFPQCRGPSPGQPREPRNFPPRAAGGGRPRPPRRAHPRAGGRLACARQRRTPRRLRGPQRLGPGDLRVHAGRPAAQRPGRCSDT